MGDMERKILQAWMTVIEAAQPEGGPLTELTAEKVGPPPAVSAGRIVTISHGDYWSGVGFTRGYLGQLLQHRANSEILLYSDAQSSGDEAKAVHHLAKSRFWKSLASWIEQVDPMPIRPEILPEWLAEFYEPSPRPPKN